MNHFFQILNDSQTSDSPQPTPSSAPDFAVQDLQSLMDDYENQILRQALEHFGYNITKTADALGLRRQSLQYRIKKYDVGVKSTLTSDFSSLATE